jgi:anti-sigma regulatory factor (Ser/Thr protein kinase)
VAVVDTSAQHPTAADDRRSASEPEVRKFFPCRPSAVADARRFVADLITDPAERDPAALLVSELATNAVLHARTSFEVAVTMFAGGIRVEVRDREPRLPAPPSLARDDEESGRGLFIVASLARVWGYTPNSDGKTVWFEIESAT